MKAALQEKPLEWTRKALRPRINSISSMCCAVQHSTVPCPRWIHFLRDFHSQLNAMYASHALIATFTGTKSWLLANFPLKPRVTTLTSVKPVRGPRGTMTTDFQLPPGLLSGQDVHNESLNDMNGKNARSQVAISLRHAQDLLFANPIVLTPYSTDRGNSRSIKKLGRITRPVGAVAKQTL